MKVIIMKQDRFKELKVGDRYVVADVGKNFYKIKGKSGKINTISKELCEIIEEY